MMRKAPHMAGLGGGARASSKAHAATASRRNQSIFTRPCTCRARGTCATCSAHRRLAGLLAEVAR